MLAVFQTCGYLWRSVPDESVMLEKKEIVWYSAPLASWTTREFNTTSAAVVYAQSAMFCLRLRLTLDRRPERYM